MLIRTAFFEASLATSSSKEDRQRFGLTLPITCVRREIFRVGREHFVNERRVVARTWFGGTARAQPRIDSWNARSRAFALCIINYGNALPGRHSRHIEEYIRLTRSQMLHGMHTPKADRQESCWKIGISLVIECWQ